MVIKNVNDTQMDFDFVDTNELLKFLYTDDFGGAPPSGLILEAVDDEGQKVRIVIPYDRKGGGKKVYVKINPPY